MPASTRHRTVFRCVDCGAASPKWAGRCDACGTWNSIVEEPDGPAGCVALPPPGPAVEIADVPTEDKPSLSTGLGEVDRVLGGGLVAGSVSLLGGEPGVGKSTLLLQLLLSLSGRGVPTLYVSAEESPTQVRDRATRIGPLPRGLLLSAETSLPEVLGQLRTVRPAVAVVDSVQVVGDPALASAPGSVAQVRHVAHQLVRCAKDGGTALILVGHVTKEGQLAGPRVLEHVVDTVLSFEGDRHDVLRTLRAVKHRYGPTGELGVMAMGEAGLGPVEDPSALFLSDRRPGVPGSVVTASLDGRRPVLVELQALVAHSALALPRRSAQGLDAGRLGMLLAVLAQRAGCTLAGSDVFTVAVGGARVLEPAADLPLALAVVSAARGEPVGSGLVAFGEVGLGGEVRRVGGLEARLQEAARLGFTDAIVPASCAGGRAPDLRIHPVRDVIEALELSGLVLSGAAAEVSR